MERIRAFCRSGILFAGIRCGPGTTQLMTSAGRCAEEFSANRTQILLEGNKVFPSLYPKIEEGETILLQACAKMIRETNKSHSQLHSSRLSYQNAASPAPVLTSLIPNSPKSHPVNAGRREAAMPSCPRFRIKSFKGGKRMLVNFWRKRQTLWWYRLNRHAWARNSTSCMLFNVDLVH